MILNETVCKILKRLSDAGYKAYVIGGAVRNYLMGIPYRDFDIASNAVPDEIASLLQEYRLDRTHRQFGTIVVIDSEHKYQITSFRSERDYVDRRHPKSVQFVKTLKEDVLRRDFSMNAIAYSPAEGFLDYCNGIQDIKDRMIRFIGLASVRIQEDPLRILRALRFFSCYPLQFESQTYQALQEYFTWIPTIHPHRIYQELSHTITGSYIKKLLEKFPRYLEMVFPDIQDLMLFSDRTLQCQLANVLQRLPADLPLRLTALFCFQTQLDKQVIEQFHHFAMPKSAIQEIEGLHKLYHVLCTVYADESTAIAQLRKLALYNDIALLQRAAILYSVVCNTFKQPSDSTVVERILASFLSSLKERPLVFTNSLAINGLDLQNAGIPKGKEIQEILHDILFKIENNELRNHRDTLLSYVNSAYIHNCKKVNGKSDQ